MLRDSLSLTEKEAPARQLIAFYFMTLRKNTPNSLQLRVSGLSTDVKSGVLASMQGYVMLYCPTILGVCHRLDS